MREDRFHLHTLPNAIRILHCKRQVPVVYCGFAINAGTRDEIAGEYGMAHFVEHMMFKGTEKYNSLQVISHLEDVGGELNAYTTKEETFVYSIVPKLYLERAVELLSDIVFNSTFPEGQIKKERKVVLEEIDMYQDSPSEQIFDDFEDMVFSSSPLGHNILGTKESLLGFSSKSCHDFVRRCYTTDQMLFFVYGDVSAEEALRLAEKHLGVSHTKRDFQRQKPNLYQPHKSVIERDTSQVHCVVGNKTLALADKKVFPLNLLNNVLGGANMTSKLNLAIRERYGWVYAIESSLNLYSDIGVWSVYFGCSNSKYEKCIGLVNSELQKLIEKPIPQKRLDMYKQQIYGQLLINTQNTENYLLSVAKNALHTNRITTLKKVLKGLEEVTPQELQEVATELFAADQQTSLTYL